MSDENPAQGAVPYMYIGPTIARLGLKQNTIVKGGEMLPQLKSIVETNPVVRALYIPTSKLGAARRNLNIQGTLEHAAAFVVTELAKKYKQ